jgi:hypothetical protein
MKNTLALILTILSGSIALNGQQYSFGFKPGFLIISGNYSDDSDFPDLKLSSRISYTYGITIENKVNQLIGFKAEPRFIAKGYNISYDATNEDKYRNNYISLPILIEFSPIKNFSLEAGPDICYLISSGIKPSGYKSYQKNKETNLKQFEFSLITGVSYLFLNRFELGFRHGFGLSASEKGAVRIFDSPGYHINYKFVQNYFEFYLNTRFLTKSKN